MKFSFTIIGLLFYLGVSAQTLPFQNGNITLKNGDKLDGYVSLVNSQKLIFKEKLNTKTKKYKAKSIQQFTYGNKTFQVIDYDKKTFFVRKIVNGEISLYKRDLATNSNKAYFIEKDNIFKQINKSKRYEVLKSQMEDATVFENYDQDFFDAAYSYNQLDLMELVDNYNAEQAKDMMAMDFIPENDTIDEIMGFATYNAYGAGNNSRKSARIPNTVRNDLVLRTEVIYNQVFDGLESNNWKKIDNALIFLKPLANELEAFHDNDLYSDLLTYARLKQKSKFKKTFVMFISNGVQSLLTAADLQKKTAMRKLVVRQAFVEFLEINDELAKTNPKLSNKIMGQFKVAFSSAANPQRFTTEMTKIQASFRAL